MAQILGPGKLAGTLKSLGISVLVSLFCLSSLEVGLRAWGYLKRRPLPSIPVQKASGGIWCLGDSFTEGTGRIYGKGYPFELETLLKPGMPVLNLGKGGSNSGEHIEILESVLRSAVPSTVIYMGGVNNRWSVAGTSGKSNFFRSRAAVFIFYYAIPAARAALRGEGVAYFRPETSGVEGLVQMFKGQQYGAVEEALRYRLGLSAREKLLLAGARFAQKKYAGAAAGFDSLIPEFKDVAMPVGIKLLAAEARRLSERRMPSEATISFFNSFRPETDIEAAVHAGGSASLYALEGKFERGATLLAETLLRFSAADDAQSIFSLKEALGWMYLMDKRRPEALRAFNEVLAAESDLVNAPELAEEGKAALLSGVAPRKMPAYSFLHAWDFFAYINNVRMPPQEDGRLETDLGRLKALSKKRGFSLVFMGYPMDYDVNGVFKRFAARENIPYVDLPREMGTLEARAGYLSGDGIHPTKAGAAAMATVLKRELKKGLDGTR